MSRARRATVVIFVLGLAVAVSALAGSTRELEARIVPYYSVAPANVQVIASIVPDDRNQRLRVEADSPNFFRSTDLPLNGSRSARVHTITLTDLPAGQYEIRIRLGRTIDEIIRIKEFIVTSETAD